MSRRRRALALGLILSIGACADSGSGPDEADGAARIDVSVADGAGASGSLSAPGSAPGQNRVFGLAGRQFTGRLTATFDVALIASDGDAVELGENGTASMQLQSGTRHDLHADVEVPAGTYTGLRFGLWGEVILDAGSTVGAATLPELEVVDIGDRVRRVIVMKDFASPRTLSAGSEMRVLIDLNSEGWITETLLVRILNNPDPEFAVQASPTEVADAITVTVAPPNGG